MKKIVAGSTAVLLMLTASGSLIGCKSAPDEPSPSSGSSLESTSGIGSSETDASADFDIDDDENSDTMIADNENASSSEALDGTEGQEGDAERVTSDGLGSSDHVDEDGASGTGNSYGLASGDGVDGDGLAAIKGGQAGDGDSTEQEHAPNDEENFPATMERLKNSNGTTATGDDGKNGQNDSDSAVAAGNNGSGSKNSGSRESAVAPNANDKSSEGTGLNKSGGNTSGNGGKNSSGGSGGAGNGKDGDKAVAANTDDKNSSGTSGSGKKGNDTGITGTSSIDGSRNANPTPPKKDDKGSGKNGSGTGTGSGKDTNANGGKNGSGSGSGSTTANTGNNKNGSGTGNQTAQNDKNKNGSGTDTGTGKDTSATGGKNGSGNGSGNGSTTANTGNNKNGSGSGNKASNTGKEITKTDGTGNGDGAGTISTKGSGDANGLDGNTGFTTAKDKQGLADDGTVDYVEKFSKWFHPALSDVQRCGYFYTTPEICQFDMIQGDFRKVSGYKKAAYGFVFGYSQPDPRGYLSDFIRFEINVDGEYALYTWDGQNYVDLVEPNDKGTAYFYEHPAIYKGYNTLNTIKVEDTGSSYNVYVNGTLIQGNIPYLNSHATKGVMAFFSVAKEHQEDLPKTPVNVGMRITDVKRH